MIAANEDRSRRRTWGFHKLGLANKLLVATLVLLVVLGSAGTAIFWVVLRGRLADEVASGTRMLALESASRAAPLIAAGDREALSALAQEIRSIDPSLGYVIVFDREGEVLAHTFAWDPPEAALARGPPGTAPGGDGHREVRIDGETHLTVAAPVRSGTRGVGSLEIGARTSRVNAFVREINLIFLLVLAGLTGVGMLAARAFFRRLTRPIAELTRLADEVSTGKQDVEFDFGVPVRCWEIKQCDRTDCAAYGSTTVQCWFVDGTPCEGYESRFPQKLMGCRTCEVYRAHKGDEIVQLADSFRHMTHDLRTSRRDLERSDRFQRSLIRNSYIGIIATDESDTVRIFNRVAQNLTGYSEAEVVGALAWERLFDPATTPRLHPVDGSRAVFGFYRRKVALRRKEGGTVAVRATGTALEENGKPIGKVFFVMDLREIQKLREDLIRSERLAATGQTVASISHSIKNILDGLRGGAHIYRRGLRVEDPAVRTKGWETVEKNIDLISELVADLLNFSVDRQPDLASCDPNVLVEDVAASLSTKAVALGVAIDTDLDSGASPSCLDHHTMHQCLTNLVTNAIDAAAGSEGGRVEIATRADADVLEIRVSDNGPGVEPEVGERLFDGMISTKGSKGSGIGLLVVYKIVNEHGGTVELDALGGPGAVFRVRLPRDGKAAVNPGVAAAHP